jgi:hypothetical protein
VEPTNVMRLAIEITQGTLKMTDVHQSLRKRVQGVLDSGSVSHMTKPNAPAPSTRFAGIGMRRARTV